MIDCGTDVSSVQCTIINLGIFISYALIAVATIATIIFPIMYAAKHFNETKNSLIAIGILAVIILLGMVFPHANLDEKIISEFSLSGGAISWVHTGIYATYIFMLLGVMALVGDLVISTAKNK